MPISGRPSALRPDAGSQMEEMVKREWSSCLRRIQKDLEANDDSSVAVYHMTNMISDVLGNIRSTVSLQGNHPEIARTRGPVSQDKYDELIAEVSQLIKIIAYLTHIELNTEPQVIS